MTQTQVSVRPAAASPAGQTEHPLVRAVQKHLFAADVEFQTYGRRGGHLRDYLFAVEPVLPADVFDRLRWGGQFVFVSESLDQTRRLADKFRDRRGFVIEREPRGFSAGAFNVVIPGLWKRAWCFAARKVALIPPGRTTDRFTYQVELVRHGDGDHGWAVLKQVPDYDQLVGRLHARRPDLPIEQVMKHARKLVDKVFPVFLSREAAFLKILERDMGERFAPRLPRVIETRKGDDGLVRQMWVTWLRNGGKPLPQIEFARQSAELLSVLHDRAGIMHLDLRLDNFVITERGVGFIDFGSAVRIGENLSQSPMLRTLFDEMMTTSQIQRDLGRMKKAGRLTSRIICDCHEKVDKAVDLFYLAVEINEPHSNPDFQDLVIHDPAGVEAAALQGLTDAIMKPADPDNPKYRSAQDVLRGIETIGRELQHAHR